MDDLNAGIANDLARHCEFGAVGWHAPCVMASKNCMLISCIDDPSIFVTNSFVEMLEFVRRWWLVGSVAFFFSFLARSKISLVTLIDISR